jgi:hypothetical protein
MSEEQLTRFEFFVRSHFPKGRIREIMNDALGPKQLVSDEMVIVVSGLAKLFVGELTDMGKSEARFSISCYSLFWNLAVEVMRERDEKGGVTPDHIQ